MWLWFRNRVITFWLPILLFIMLALAWRNVGSQVMLEAACDEQICQVKRSDLERLIKVLNMMDGMITDLKAKTGCI